MGDLDCRKLGSGAKCKSLDCCQSRKRWDPSEKVGVISIG